MNSRRPPSCRIHADGADAAETSIANAVITSR
jgi:hypothetical protein